MKNTPTSPKRAPITSELIVESSWNTRAIRELIAKKTNAGRRPAFLFLGRHEANLLRENLGMTFGPDAVRSLKNVYYLGLEVIELDTPAFFRTAGMKRIQEFRKRGGTKPTWKDVSGGSVWHFEM